MKRLADDLFGFSRFLLLVGASPLACGDSSLPGEPPSGTSIGSSDEATSSEGMASADDGSSSDETSAGSTSESSSDADGSSSSDTTGGQSSCAGTGVCTPAVEPAWSGPIALRDASVLGAEACGGAFPIASATVHDELVAPPAECTCSCEPEGEATCAGSSGLRQYETDDCGGGSDDWSVTTSCNPSVAGAAGTSFLALNVEVQGVTCEPQFTEVVTPAAFERTYALCLPESAASCGDGGLCVPELEQAEDQLCIWHEGDFACPETWTGDRHLFYREFIDERRCSACTCDEFWGSCSGYTIQLFGTDSCNEAPIGGVTPGSCEELSFQGATAARRTGVGVPDVDCAGFTNGSEAIGSAGPTSPVTVCCVA